MSPSPLPLVVQYLYVHEHEESFHYPTARSESSAGEVAVRYLECALTQAASLRLQEARCDLALATNVQDRSVLGRTGAELMSRIEALGVQILPTEYRHRPSEGTEIYVSSRYVLDAILSSAAGEIGCIYIGYPPDWDTVGFGAHGLTRLAIGELAAGREGSEEAPPWVGGEVLSGTPAALQELVKICENLDAELAAEGKTLPTEEQVLSLAGATGRVQFRDLSHVARRMPTGPRNHSARVEDPLSIGLWHLPAEKGLSLRRTANDIRRGAMACLRKDLSEPARAAKRFNVAGTGLRRRIQDDG